jgi:hypothetical protein
MMPWADINGSRLLLLIVLAVVAMIVMMFGLDHSSRTQCPDGKVAVLGDDQWYCVDGQKIPDRIAPPARS